MKMFKTQEGLHASASHTRKLRTSQKSQDILETMVLQLVAAWWNTILNTSSTKYYRYILYVSSS